MELSTLIELYGQESKVPLSMKENGTLALAFDENITVNLEHEATSDLLHLYTVVGTEPHSDLESSIVFRLLLGANCFDRGTNGATLGLDHNNKEILLTNRVYVKDTSVSHLSKTIQSMAEMCKIWQDRLARPQEEASRQQPRMNSNLDAPMFGMHA